MSRAPCSKLNDATQNVLVAEHDFSCGVCVQSRTLSVDYLARARKHTFKFCRTPRIEVFAGDTIKSTMSDAANSAQADEPANALFPNPLLGAFVCGSCKSNPIYLMTMPSLSASARSSFRAIARSSASTGYLEKAMRRLVP